MRISDWSSDVCSSDLSATDRETLSHPLAGQVWDLLNKRYPQRPFGLDGSLQLDLGIDSLEWVTLSLEIERRLGIGLDEAELAEVYTVRELIQAVQRAAQRTDGRAPAQRKVVAEAARRRIEPGHLGHRLLAITLFAVTRLPIRLLLARKSHV